MTDKIFLEGLTVKCRIGIFDWERKILQKIVIDMEIPTDVRRAARTDRIQNACDYKSIAKFTQAFVGKSSYFLIETLAEKLAAGLLKKFKLKEIRLRLSKPGAIRHSKTVGVEIVRRKGR